MSKESFEDDVRKMNEELEKLTVVGADGRLYMRRENFGEYCLSDSERDCLMLGIGILACQRPGWRPMLKELSGKLRAEKQFLHFERCNFDFAKYLETITV